jgi:hypothetical protein
MESLLDHRKINARFFYCTQIQAILFRNAVGFECYFNAGQSNHLYETLREDISMQTILANAAGIDEAKIRFQFRAKGNRPYTSVTFEIGEPSKNTIRHLPQELIDIINKHLERWGIEHHAKTAEVYS